ncbi:hypothetical protein [Fusobacterium sp. PH5-44]|uniref:hypothetical protein n=1 Tax=unclassified Fusobacterium TaxID=2648384 RepID=UPI003D20D8B2
MLLCIIEYLYGISYFIFSRLSDEKLAGKLGVVKDNIFRNEIMFFIGLLSFFGIISSFLGLVKKDRKKKLILLGLHLIFFYIYMNYFLKVPVSNIFTLATKVSGYIKLLTK